MRRWGAAPAGRPEPNGGTLWIALNTQRPPFDDLDVRRAVVAGFDRKALRLTRGGREAGPIAQHFIPPGTPGFDESGGERGFAEVDYMRDPGGDREIAARYLRAAGHASGRYDGDAKVTAIGASAEPDRQAADVAQQQLEELGFDVELRKLAATRCSRSSAAARLRILGLSQRGWARDFPDPQSLLEPTFKGAAILPQGNVNWSQLDDPEIDAAMARAAALPAGEERIRAWAEINRWSSSARPRSRTRGPTRSSSRRLTSRAS